MNPGSIYPIDADESFQRLYRLLRSLRCRPEESNPTHVISGLETQTNPESYAWHGRRRFGDRRRPFVVWQYTLAGKGALLPSAHESPVALYPGDAFVSIVPSDDCYYLPAESKLWTFYWLIIDHPYVVQRIQKRVRLTGPVWRISPASALIGHTLELFDLSRAASLPDEFAAEADLFAFLTEFERLGHQILYPPLPRETLLSEIRKQVHSALPQRVLTVAELAKRRGMGRSAFSHLVRRATGTTPARFITQIRIEEAARTLVGTSLKLAAIARMTGFADATHFGKVFRRFYHLTPDKYRHVMRNEVVDPFV